MVVESVWDASFGAFFPFSFHFSLSSLFFGVDWWSFLWFSCSFRSTMDSISIRTYIKQLAHYDNQERYMGLNDLGRELAKEGGIPDGLERTICEAVLSKLDDPSTDVQSIAVKTLALLLKKVGPDEICMIR